MAIILRNSGRISFPSGRNPRFDPSHPAANGVNAGNGFSGIATISGGFVNLLTGNVGAVVGSPTKVLDAHIGPAVKFTGSSDAITFAGQKGTASQNWTFGVILIPHDVSGTNYINWFSNSNDANGIAIGQETGSGGDIGIFANGQDSTYTSSVLSADRPYFVGATGTFSSHTASFVILDLITGALEEPSINNYSAFMANISGGTYSVGNRNSSRVASASIAAVMYAPLQIAASELTAWASDPWSFWYPPGYEAIWPTMINNKPPIAALPVLDIPRRRFLRVGTR